MQVCLAAVTPVISNLKDNMGLSKPVVMACQLLYSMGEFLPAANGCLLVVKDIARQQAVDLPKACRFLYAALAVRMGTILLRDVRVVDFGPNKNGPSVESSEGVFQEVIFSSQIESIRNLVERNL